MKLLNDQALDANGVKHLWKRILDLVHGSTPTKVSELENDKGYLSVGVTSFNGSTGDVNVTIPTKTSQLQNDSGFVTADESTGYTKSETDALLDNKQNVISDLSTIRNGAALGATALQSYTETDPTVPAWAKASSKPTYTAQEVGALPNTTVIPEGIPAGGTTGQVLRKTSNSDYAVEWDDEEGGGGGGEDNVIEVVKVNGTALTPDVNKAVDVTVPTKVSDLNNDSGFTNNTGTITSVKMNGSTVASSGEANLGTVLTSHQDISGKVDKVTSATNGNFAGLDANGNLTDSGHKHSDYLTSHQDLSNYVQKSNTAGLLKNDGTIDTNTYLTSSTAHQVPSGGNSGQVLKKSSATDYDYAWANQTQDYPSAYCKTAAGTAGKTAACTLWTATANTYLHLVIVYANTSASALTLNVNSTNAATIYINGVVSSATNYTLPAGSYIAFYDGTYWYINTDGTIPRVPSSTDVKNIVSISQSAYDALATKDSSTLYLITS